MKFYGKGVLLAPNSSRVVHDFEDGPFETLNPEIIEQARKQGFSTEAPESLPVASAPVPSSGRKGKSK